MPAVPLGDTKKLVGAVTVKLPEAGNKYEPVRLTVAAADDVPTVVGGKAIDVGVTVATGGGAMIVA